MNLPFLLTPMARAQDADSKAGEALARAKQRMDTKAVKEALERRHATTHALMAEELRMARKERSDAHAMGWAAE